MTGIITLVVLGIIFHFLSKKFGGMKVAVYTFCGVMGMFTVLVVTFILSDSTNDRTAKFERQSKPIQHCHQLANGNRFCSRANEDNNFRTRSDSRKETEAAEKETAAADYQECMRRMKLAHQKDGKLSSSQSLRIREIICTRIVKVVRKTGDGCHWIGTCSQWP